VLRPLGTGGDKSDGGVIMAENVADAEKQAFRGAEAPW
jgi:hypothetical protein